MRYGQSAPPQQRVASAAIVISLHVGLAYGLVSVLSHNMVEIVKAPLLATVIMAPEKPPEEKPLAVAPKLVTPPPPFIPLPDVVIRRAPTENAITVVSTAKPETPVARPVTHQPPVTPPVVDADLTCDEPLYPTVSRQLEEEGTVRLQFLISPRGEVLQSRIERSSGYPRLDTAAVEALSKCRFKPGTVDGKPEQSWARLEYVWQLN